MCISPPSRIKNCWYCCAKWEKAIAAWSFLTNCLQELSETQCSSWRLERKAYVKNSQILYSARIAG
jgi:hypothetical protein